MFTTQARILACAVVMLALTSSCEEHENDRGTLIVQFKLGNDRSCDSFHVKTVRGTLENDGDDYSESAKCESKELRFEDVPSGEYKLKLFGYTSDDDDNPVMDSLQDDNLTMNVIGDDTTVIAERKVMLTSSPAHLMVRWSFGYGTCKSAGIGSFIVTVWRNDGSDLLLEDELDCEDVGDADDAFYRKIPDDKRMLSGTESGEVAIQPLDKGGKEIGEALTYDFKAPGPGKDIKLSLKCDEDEEVKAGVSCWAEKSDATAAK
jgi:hypothetical protein